MIGESPNRPWIFQARPDVLTAADISPFRLSVMHGIVPVGGFKTYSIACSRHSGSMPISAATSCKRLVRCSATGTFVKFVGGFQFGSERLGTPQPRSDIVSFQSSHILRERSVSRFSS